MSPADPPSGAQVQFIGCHSGTGWNAPTFTRRLQTASDFSGTVAHILSAHASR